MTGTEIILSILLFGAVLGVIWMWDDRGSLLEEAKFWETTYWTYLGNTWRQTQKQPRAKNGRFVSRKSLMTEQLKKEVAERYNNEHLTRSQDWLNF